MKSNKKDLAKARSWSSHCIACNTHIDASERKVNSITGEYEPYCRVCWYWIQNSVQYHEEDYWRVKEIVWGNPDEKMGGGCQEMEIALHEYYGTKNN